MLLLQIYNIHICGLLYLWFIVTIMEEKKIKYVHYVCNNGYIYINTNTVFFTNPLKPQIPLKFPPWEKALKYFNHFIGLG